MFEDNYSYSVIAKKLSRSKGWVSKWTRRWNTKPAEFLQSQFSGDWLTKLFLNLTAQRRIIRNSKYQTLHSTGRLASKFARFVSDWKHLEHYGCSCLCQPASPEPQTLTALERRLQKSWRSISFTTLQILIGSMPDRLKAVMRKKWDTVPLTFVHCLEVTLSSHYCAIFGCCNSTEYSCWAVICIIFFCKQTIFACLWSLQHTSFRFQNRSRWSVSPYSNSFFIYNSQVILLIWRTLHLWGQKCKANGVYDTINLFTCNFAKCSPILLILFLSNWVINLQ